VDLDVAGAVAQAGQETGVVPAPGLQPSADRRDVVILPDLQGGADGQPVAGAGQAHRLAEAAEVRVERSAVGAEHHQLARLVGGDEDRQAQFVEQGGETRGVYAAQRG